MCDLAIEYYPGWYKCKIIFDLLFYECLMHKFYSQHKWLPLTPKNKTLFFLKTLVFFGTKWMKTGKIWTTLKNYLKKISI